ncbi:hypothetical protein GCM10025857_15100 [Alicyclobacillus contaminans]|uniref:RusA family crossover junction endodeoxyribonuclease n=1 Tax=Alicyclobacillus contaminans TaxID=392016 RepID=UPI00047A5810|nr:RusA family crossover junction endodeoxyribonuclease [Alicyclobacillus contaminans]GMA50153.1 hypothetical protein GCM10025857_15100 [Alicyclobacillus contaminans]
MSRLVLPLPPSVNHAYRNFTTANGRRMRVPTREAARFKRDAAWLAKAWRADTRWSIPPEDRKVIVRMWVYWRDWRRRDTDNTWKLTLDALKGILYEDDSMCLPQVIDFGVDRENPRVEIELEVKEGSS